MTERKNKIVLAGAMAGIVACTGDFLVLFIYGSRFPGYSQMYNTMSSLGATVSPVSSAVSTWWVLLGILFVFFGYSFRKMFNPRNHLVIMASWLLIIYGLGEFIGSGLFKADHIGNTVTQSAIVHGILGTIGIAAILILPLLMQKIIPRSTNPVFYWFSFTVLFIGMVLMVLFNFRFFHPADCMMNSLEGFWQRLFTLDYYIYLFTVIFIVLRREFSVNQPFSNA